MEELKKFDKLDNTEAANIADEGASFDIRTIFTLFILNWQWFLLSMFICVCASLIYLRYTDPVYKVSAKMLIKDDVSNSRRNSNQMLANMQDLGIMTNSAGIENEVEILTSHILAREAVKDLKLYVEYYSAGRLKKRLSYKNQPINVDIDPLSLSHMEKEPFTVKLTIDKGKKYNVTGEIITRGGDPTTFKSSFTTLPASITTKVGTLTFTKGVTGKEPSSYKLYASIYPPANVAARYVNSLTVAPTSKVTSIALLTLSDKNPLRGIDYLKQLAVVYNRQANADKNEIAYKTEQFINDRLEKINAELGETEGVLEDYKRRNNLTQLRLDASETLSRSSEYARLLSESNTQLQLLDYLREYIEDPANKYQLIPSNVGLKDAASIQLISSYNQNIQDRNRMLRSASEMAPQVQTITSTIDDLRRSVSDALKQARRGADIQRQGIESQYKVYSEKVSSTPEQERILTQIGRQQEVKSGLYLMLLQKREENSISLAATADKGKLIDDPRYGGKMSPRGSIIMLAAIFLGFAIPLLVVWLLQVLRYKIEGHEDVAKLTALPIVADVPIASESAKNVAGIVVKENQNNQIDEIFRSLRTNIQFLMKENDKVVLFTSSTSGEGKTFNAANLAASFAFLGKRVILCGLDIRKPALGRLFNISDRSKGITALLVKDEVAESDLTSNISNSGVTENLDLLLAGPTPPNPTELLSRPSLEKVINMLKERYDYVILDTAPVGLVTDTLQIGRYTDVTAFVCRSDYTPKSSFSLINTLSKEQKMPNMCVVLNGVDMSKKKYGYYYGYGKYGKYGQYIYGRYGYGYGNYGYGNYGHYYGSHYGKKDDTSIKR